jgi:hypothetical protein
MKVLIALAALAAVAIARPDGPHLAPAYHAAAPQPNYDEPPKYAYQYGVHDDYSKANFGQNEQRDGYATNGEYRVQLPDGRTQIVTYTVGDAYSGYVADVRYEGEATYPEYKPTYKVAPAYHAAPAPAYTF